MVPGAFFLSFSEGEAVDIEKTENLWDQGIMRFFSIYYASQIKKDER